MKIALITSLLSGGGAARVLVNMANYWDAQGHDIVIVTFESEGADPFYDISTGVSLVHLGLNRSSQGFICALSNNWKRLRKIRETVVALAPNAVISFVDTANVLSLLALAGTSIPVVVSERVDPAHEDIGKMWEMLRFLSYPLASNVVVQTREAARYFSKYFIKDLRVIPNPVVPPAEFDSTLISAPFIMGAGRLCRQKRFDVLIDAFSLIANTHPDWNLCIAGEGPLKRELQSQTYSLGLENRIFFPGHIKEIGGLFRQADVFVLSSDYEGFPNVLCEAMCAGLPCVSSDCPSGPSDIIEDGKSGFLVPPGDKDALAHSLATLVKSKTLRKTIGREAAEAVKKWKTPIIMGKWEELL
ncbi:glycosyltransferase family 4 protein [Salidesulfovibrio brasiliensis]|uniref:glycosyltransferase family 4 protein n=1 Tax=Salidesulfovibrio brasiliensis TaxID=221711 RepID=UPI0009F9B441|nr:glycosyltransferase family 4 protein [Salidesulfovibrio brasiliensis]